MALSTDLVKRLMYSKHLLRRGITLQKEATELSAAEAVLPLHDAVEMLMRVVTDYLKMAPTFTFMDFWSKVSQRGFPEPPHKGALKRLNQLRVGFKHDGNLPNPSVVADLLPRVIDFCVETTGQFLNTDFDSISLADLLSNADARASIKEAEKTFASNDIKSAVLSLGFAFDALYREAVGKSTRDLIGEGVLEHFFSDYRSEDLARELGIEDLKERMKEVTDAINIILLGIDLQKFRRFSRLTPYRTRNSSGEVIQVVWGLPTSSLDADSYRFCLDFVIDVGLRLEEREIQQS